MERDFEGGDLFGTYRPESLKGTPDRWNADSSQRPDDVRLDATPVARIDDEPVNAQNSGTSAVDTKALAGFADAVAQLIPMIDKTIPWLENLAIMPGNFPHAAVLQKKVYALKGTYGTNLQSLKAGLEVLCRRLKELARKHETIEELNSAGGQALAKLLTEVDSFMPQIPGGAGTTPAPAKPNPLG